MSERPGTRRRRVVAALLAVLAAGAVGGCAGGVASPSAALYHWGELSIGTSNTTGIFYTLGATYAGIISAHLPGYEALAAPTPGSLDNLRRLDSGDLDVAFVFASNAADALVGQNQFAGHPLPIRALARIHSNYTQVVVRDAAHITSFAQLRGHRISLGPKNSGTEALSRRMLQAAGVDPAKDITPLSMSLPETVSAMVAGSIDAMFYSAGLPTPGISELFSKAAGTVHLLPANTVLPELEKTYGAGVYTSGAIPKDVYGTPDDVPTIVEPNLLVVRADLPEELQYELTKLLFTYQAELVKVSPAANEIMKTTGPQTAPVTLAPGAERYYRTG